MVALESAAFSEFVPTRLLSCRAGSAAASAIEKSLITADDADICRQAHEFLLNLTVISLFEGEEGRCEHLRPPWMLSKNLGN
jgi:hypothetical protein